MEDVPERRELFWPLVSFPVAPFQAGRFFKGAANILLAVLLLWWWLRLNWIPIFFIPVATLIFILHVSRKTSETEEALWRELYQKARAGEWEAAFAWGLLCVGHHSRDWEVAYMAMVGGEAPNTPEVILRPEAGIPFLLKAAEKNHAGAQCALGKCYADGIGIARDPKQAVKWLRLAAEQGLMEAQRNLARMYDDGIGVPHSTDEAIRWYRLAAAQGDEYSRRDLVRLGVTGEPDFLAS